MSKATGIGYSYLTFAVVACILATASAAQSPATVSGIVTDSAGVPIMGAVLTINGTSLRATSDERGEFRIGGLAPGPTVLQARRLGYAPVSIPVVIARESGPGSKVAISLVPIAISLDPVVVLSKRGGYTGRLAGYYSRLERGGSGHFIPREQIDRENPRMLSHLLAHVPGVAAIRLRGGRAGIRMRGRNCWPLVWIDGTPMPSGEVDLDAFAPSTLHGIEIYLGSTTAPIRYIGSRDLSSCGTVLLWSRGPDTDPVTRTPRPSYDLEQLVASSNVYTADQVDRRAKLDSVRSPDPAYPPSLYAAGTRGRVVAEFVVDATGRIERGTFGIVSSAYSLFTAAVEDWSETALYSPAVRGGQPVKQLVQQPFDFSPENRRSRGLTADSRPR